MGAIKDIPQQIYASIIVDHKMDPDRVYNELKCVEFNDKPNKVKRYRIFNVNELPQGIKVQGYESFDNRPELVMFEGLLGKDDRMELKRTG